MARRRRLRNAFRTVTEYREGAEPDETPSEDRASQRVYTLPTTELIPWAERSIYGVGRALSKFQRDGNVDWVADAALEADTLKVILDELMRRVTK